MNEPVKVEIERLTKAQLRALENVFAAEIEGRMFQSKAKVYQKLAEEGYLVAAERRFSDRLGTMVCRGWDLTHAGRITYCMSCDDGEPE